MANEFLKPYQILLKKAIVDLNTAKVILVSFEKGEIELDLEVIFFHLQQSAEKLIKSILDFYVIKFPHTHDLRILISLLNENKITTIDEIDELNPLTGYAVEGRYDVLHDDLNDTDKYIEILNRLLDFTKNLIIGEKNEKEN